MTQHKISLQLYTVRDCFTSIESIDKTIKRISEIGYKAVEVAGMNDVNITPKQFKEIANKNEIEIIGFPFRYYDGFFNESGKTIEKCKTYECRHVAVGMPHEIRWHKEGYTEFAGILNRIGELLLPHGTKPVFHNHNFEFQKFDGRTGQDILFDETDPELVDFEIDTYWVQAGGDDPARWIRKAGGRMHSVHFKDMLINNERQQISTEIGDGNLNWERIIKECREAGIEYYCVEQDFCKGNPLDSVEISFKNMKKMGL